MPLVFLIQSSWQFNHHRSSTLPRLVRRLGGFSMVMPGGLLFDVSLPTGKTETGALGLSQSIVQYRLKHGMNNNESSAF